MGKIIEAIRKRAEERAVRKRCDTLLEIAGWLCRDEVANADMIDTIDTPLMSNLTKPAVLKIDEWKGGS